MAADDLWMAFPAPDVRLSMNDRMHWAKRARIVEVWRHAGFVYAKKLRFRDVGPRIIQVSFHVKGNLRRDGLNMAPTVKALVDGYVDAGMFPDDTPEWVEVMDSKFVVVPKNEWKGHEMVSVRLKLKDAADERE